MGGELNWVSSTNSDPHSKRGRNDDSDVAQMASTSGYSKSC